MKVTDRIYMILKLSAAEHSGMWGWDVEGGAPFESAKVPTMLLAKWQPSNECQAIVLVAWSFSDGLTVEGWKGEPDAFMSVTKPNGDLEDNVIVHVCDRLGQHIDEVAPHAAIRNASPGSDFINN